MIKKLKMNHLTPLLLSILLGLNGCALQSGHPGKGASGAIPRDEPLSCYGNENHYVVEGKHYHVLKSSHNYNKVGVASWYGNKFHGHLTSSRERYDMFGMSAASRDLPLPTYVKVTNLENGRSVVVRVNDRGPFKSNRLIDVSYAAAKKIGLIGRGTGKVRVTAINLGKPKSLDSLATRRFLQVGSFSESSNANRYKSKITQMTQSPVKVRRIIANNRPVYRVEVGPFTDQQSLDNTQRNLQKRGVKNITSHFG
jgi:rare lipoprotein A